MKTDQEKTDAYKRALAKLRAMPNAEEISDLLMVMAGIGKLDPVHSRECEEFAWLFRWGRPYPYGTAVD